MEAWAKTIPEARFICVCVESLQVAVAFHQMFRFERVVNGWIPSQQYFPVGYGQLGCSGFIVSDSQGRFVSRKTRSFLDHDEAAFRHVESLLSRLVVPKEDDDDAARKRRKGGEEKKDEEKSSSETKRNLKEKVTPPPSVGVDIMDDEHKECADRFNAVVDDPSADNLRRLRDALRDHFAHEEDIMSRHMKGGAFSALDSHRADHARILAVADGELDRVGGCGVLKGN